MYHSTVIWYSTSSMGASFCFPVFDKRLPADMSVLVCLKKHVIVRRRTTATPCLTSCKSGLKGHRSCPILSGFHAKTLAVLKRNETDCNGNGTLSRHLKEQKTSLTKACQKKNTQTTNPGHHPQALLVLLWTMGHLDFQEITGQVS